MRLVDVDPIRIEAPVSELDIARVQSGQRGIVRVDGLSGEEFVGTIVDIAPQASRDSRNYVARIEVANPRGKIKPGMFARVALILESHADTVLVPREAVVESADKRLVYVVEDGKIQVREVELGASSGNILEIIKGVEPGDRLVTTDQDRLAEGQRVEAHDRGSAFDEQGDADEHTATPDADDEA